MINIYNIPLYYIGFKKKPSLELQLQKHGFKNINHFQAIDGRKMNPKNLLLNKIISIRAYNDLVYKREQHTGISSLGTIGCTLSHLELWKKCANGLPYIIIAEDDLILKKIQPSDEKNIKLALSNKNGAFISANVKKGDELLFGLHFYFLTNGAAKELVKNALPIDLQTDSYVGNLNNVGKINAKGYYIGTQKLHSSSTGNTCVKCYLPKHWGYYVFFLILLIIGIAVLFITISKNKKLKIELESCKSSGRCY